MKKPQPPQAKAAAAIILMPPILKALVEELILHRQATLQAAQAIVNKLEQIRVEVAKLVPPPPP